MELSRYPKRERRFAVLIRQLRKLFTPILIVGVLSSCSARVEDFVILQFMDAEVYIYLPARYDDYHFTGVVFEESSDPIKLDRSKRRFEIRGKGIVRYGDGIIVYDDERVTLNGQPLGGDEDEPIIFYLLAPSGRIEEGQLIEDW